VRTSTGRRIACDVVVIGVGAAPRVELAEAAGLLVEDGVAVDERLETSVPGVFAAGDVAAAWHPFYQARIRVEHWANALHQGETAARNMLGLATPYERLPYFFSDQYDLGMEYTGYAPRWDKVVFRGDPGTRQFIAFWLSDGRVVAGMNANVWDVTGPIGELIRRRMPIDASLLADPDVPLEDLVGTPQPKG
jgi:3-phenylpropionate/trans-cinnamate dioxygenase ferredoxin reductase subunit